MNQDAQEEYDLAQHSGAFYGAAPTSATPTDEDRAFRSITHSNNPDISALPDRSHGRFFENFFEKKKTSGTLNLNSESDDHLPPGFGQYDDFHTIDWQRDLARDRKRHRYFLIELSLKKSKK